MILKERGVDRFNCSNSQIALCDGMSVLLEQLAKEGEVPLERYGHQVGGRQLLFKYKDSICKPLIAREHFFYETAPEAIRRYIPCYYGVIRVCYVKQPSGGIQAIASVKEQRVPLLSSIQPDKQFPKCTTGITLHSEGVSITSEKLVNGDKYINPWATMCSENLDERLKGMDEGLQNFNKDYLILENLTTKFQAPSVLDLKVGTNMRGDNHSVNQQISTTQPNFMVRMAGMQKFDALNNQYTFYDKYFGKQFSEKEFSQVLHSFLNNGMCFRSDLIVIVIRMLKDLKASIRSRPSFRYFSSSLLLIYDGAECPESLCKCKTKGKPMNCTMDVSTKAMNCTMDVSTKPMNCTMDVSTKAMNCMMDVSTKPMNCTMDVSTKPMNCTMDVSTKAMNCTMDISNAIPTSTKDATPTSTGLGWNVMPTSNIEATPISTCNGHLNNCPSLSTSINSLCVQSQVPIACNGTPLPPTQCQPHENHIDETLAISKMTAPRGAPSLMSTSELEEARCHFDLRMIDFARSTHPSYYDPVCYKGLDECYLSGLDSLIGIFQKMKDGSSFSEMSDFETTANLS